MRGFQVKLTDYLDPCDEKLDIAAITRPGRVQTFQGAETFRVQ